MKIEIITDRLKMYKDIKNRLGEIIPNSDEIVCMNDYGNINIVDFIDETKKIGSSSKYGDVYKVVLPTKNKKHELSIKLVPLTYKDRIHMYDTRFPVWRELKSLKLLSHLVKKQICPNLPLMYEFYVCNYCEYKNEQLTNLKSKMCLLILNELSDTDLRNWIIEKSNVKIPEQVRIDEWYNCYFQILASIYTIQKYYQLAHRDLHWGNILINYCSSEGYWIYIIENIHYYIPNIGFIVKLWDFGKSLSITHFRHNIEDVKVIESENIDETSTKTSLYGSDVHKISNIYKWITSTTSIKNKNVLPEKIIGLLKEFQKNENNVLKLIHIFMAMYLNNRIGTDIDKNHNIIFDVDPAHLYVGDIVAYNNKYALILSIYNLRIKLITELSHKVTPVLANNEKIGKFSEPIEPLKISHLNGPLLGIYKI